MNKYKPNQNLILLFIIIVFPRLYSAQEIDPNLSHLINSAIQKSHSLKVESLNAQSAKIDQKLVKSNFIPKVTVNGGYTRLDDDITLDDNTLKLLNGTQRLLIKEALGLPFNYPLPASVPLEEIPTIQDKNVLKSSVDVEWTLFTGLMAANGLKANQHKEASLLEMRNAKADQLVLEVINYYDQLALVKASETVLLVSTKYLQDQQRFVAKAIDNGLATPIERKKIELAQQQLTIKKVEINQSKQLLLEVLAQLTGEKKSIINLYKTNLSIIELDTLIGQEKRSELIALEHAEIASDYKSKMIKSNFIPKIGVKGHYEILDRNLTILDPKWYVGVGVKWNLFDGNQSHLKSKQAVIEKQKYREQISEAEELINLQIVKSEFAYEAALENVKLVEKEIELAEATYKMVNEQYKNKLSSVSDVLESLKDLEKANFKLEEAYFKQRNSVRQLLYAKGKLNY